MTPEQIAALLLRRDRSTSILERISDRLENGPLPQTPAHIAEAFLQIEASLAALDNVEKALSQP